MSEEGENTDIFLINNAYIINTHISYLFVKSWQWFLWNIKTTEGASREINSNKLILHSHVLSYVLIKSGIAM